MDQKFIHVKILLFFLLIIINSANAQTDVPDLIKQKFESNFSDEDVSWKNENANYIASGYKSDGLKRKIIFNSDGNIIRKETEVLAKDLPTVVSNYFEEAYPSEKNYTVLIIEITEGDTYYQSSKNDKMILVDKSGHIVDNVAPVKQ